MAKLMNRVVVCGVGLIGGSFAMALREAGAVGEIIGLGRSAASLQRARDSGVIDRIASGWAEALEGADLVLLAMPVGQMRAVMSSLVPHLAPGTVVTDAGSTKRDVVSAAREIFGERIGQFVPGHPIAGAEKSGVEEARIDLYRGRRVILTPLPENEPAAVQRVRACWLRCGAVVRELSPEAHDRIFATVSHLPHLLAFALVDELAARSDAEQLFGFAAGGFRDFTRIAGSHPEMWRDICMANRDLLSAELDAYMAHLGVMRDALRDADDAALEAAFTRARDARIRWAPGFDPAPQ